MTDRNDAHMLQLQELVERQDLLLQRTRNTDLTATKIKDLVEQLPELLQPEDKEASLAIRLTELLASLKDALQENNQQQAEIIAVMERQEQAMVRQAKAFEALNRALYIDESDGTHG